MSLSFGEAGHIVAGHGGADPAIRGREDEPSQRSPWSKRHQDQGFTAGQRGRWGRGLGSVPGGDLGQNKAAATLVLKPSCRKKSGMCDLSIEPQDEDSSKAEAKMPSHTLSISLRGQQGVRTSG